MNQKYKQYLEHLEYGLNMLDNINDTISEFGNTYNIQIPYNYITNFENYVQNYRNIDITQNKNYELYLIILHLNKYNLQNEFKNYSIRIQRSENMSDTEFLKEYCLYYKYYKYYNIMVSRNESHKDFNLMPIFLKSKNIILQNKYKDHTES